MEIKKILVATDFSPRSRYAVQRATQLARALDAKLSVLQVIEPKFIPWEGLEAPNEAINAEDRMRQLVAQTAGGRLENYYPCTRSGKPFVEIIEAARSVQADLIVLGAHGKHFFRDVFLGTTAEKVVRNGDRPVLVVRKPPQGDYRRVLAAADFSKLSRNALEMALSMTPNAEFYVLHAYEYPSIEAEVQELAEAETSEAYMRELRQRAREALDAFLNDVDLTRKKIKRVVEFGYPPAVIRLVASRRRPDLVVVGATGASDLRHSLLGSTAAHVLRELRSDVLVVRAGMPLFELP